MIWCKEYKSPAMKRYIREFLIAMSSYVVILCAAVRLGRPLIKHGWPLYLMAILPALPVIGILAIMGRYLQDETDEYRRLLAVRSLMAATGVLLTTIVVNDFLRAFAHRGSLPPFVSFDVFMLALAIAQVIQCRASRGCDDE
jgi:hypothetical protein